MRLPVAGACAIVVLLFTLPLFVFVRPLRRARLRGTFEYGALASALGRQFEEQWIRRSKPVDAEALGAPDFSATTDLYAIAANVRQMLIVPMGIRPLLMLVVATLVPFVPVAIAVLPSERLVELLSQMLF
jgi:hypothetical protein